MATALQVPGIPAGPEVLIFLLILVVIGILVGRWVYRDAKSRGSNWAWQWGVGTAILLVPIVPGLIVLIIYLFVRGNKTQEKQQTT
jgi:uncharacterized membrane protein